MLLQATICNYKGFGKKQTLDLTATSQNEFREELIQINDNVSVITKACLIGPNGAGKSQLLDGLDDLSMAIRKSDLSWISKPFALSPEFESQPTEFSLLLFDKELNEFLNYTISVLNEAIVEESLYVKENKKNKKSRLVFKRENELKEFGSEYHREAQLTKNIKDDTPIVKFASGLDNKYIECINEWARSVLLFTPKTMEHGSIEMLNNAFKEVIKEIKKGLDEQQEDEDNLEKHVTKIFSNVFQDVVHQIQTLDIPLESIEIDLSAPGGKYLMFTPKSKLPTPKRLTAEEAKKFFSTGSFNAIVTLITFSFLSTKNHTILLDEIDGTFHHKLTRTLLDVLTREKDDKTSQLILATHDILLLDSGFRRDAINTISKDKDSFSVIKRVSEFPVRKDAKLSSKYFLDEFGALPRILEVPKPC